MRIFIQFDPLDENARASLASLGRCLTDEPQSVRVSAQDDAPNWGVVEFTMPTESQYKVVDTIDHAIKRYADDRLDSIIDFPKSPAERERDRLKAERRKERRRMRGTN